jgi:hypothetical protein
MGKIDERAAALNVRPGRLSDTQTPTLTCFATASSLDG